jgi:D-arabinose 1-dehydrogenase-like Zn-dependent alcohol dehydrogenase
MRAAAFNELVGPDGVEVIDLESPEPGPGEAVVDVEACSINRHDLWILEGDSAMVDSGALPFVSGLDVVGVVRETGEGAAVETGARVLLYPGETCGSCEYCREGPENLCASFSLFHGGLAEQVSVDASRLVTLPDGVGAVAAAALPTAYLTAWHMLRKAAVTAGDLVFVPGVTGGVGVAAVQLGALRGAETIGTSTSASKLSAVADLGCAHTVETADPDEMAAAVEAVGTVDAVINHLGGEYVEVGRRVARRGARQVLCGRTAGNEATVSVAPLFLEHHELVGSTMGTQPELARLVDLVAAGDLEPAVAETYPLAATGDAFRDMAEREAVGKLVVTP